MEMAWARCDHQLKGVGVRGMKISFGKAVADLNLWLWKPHITMHGHLEFGGVLAGEGTTAVSLREVGIRV